MNKGKGIGIFVSVIAVAIVVGIASLPDEVLLESPSVESSATDNMNLPIPIIEEPVETEPEVIEETGEGNVIEIRIKDGIGSKDK